jgi:hypothetical protein
MRLAESTEKLIEAKDSVRNLERSKLMTSVKESTDVEVGCELKQLDKRIRKVETKY